MEATVGRIVHYVGDFGNHRAAIIVNARPDAANARQRVDLYVFFDRSEAEKWDECFKRDVAHDEAGAEFTWHWPERL